jgi:hypothetical protein
MSYWEAEGFRDQYFVDAFIACYGYVYVYSGRPRIEPGNVLQSDRWRGVKQQHAKRAGVSLDDCGDWVHILNPAFSRVMLSIV